MLRLAKFAAVLACVVGTSGPSVSEAGVIPWAYDSVFGPVGSMQRSYYTPYYAGYSGYTGASYQPAAYSSGYATNGCSSCQQSSYYASTYGSCGCSPCGSTCSSGCASGNCTANSVPTGGLSPVADPNNYSRGTESRGVESRLEAIERQLNIVPPRDHTGTRSRTYDDEFNATPRPRTRTNDGLGSGSSIPAREPYGTGTRRPAGSGIDAEGYSTPSVRTPAHGTNTDAVDDGTFRANPPARTGPDGASSGTRDTFKVNTDKINTDQSGSEKSDSAASDSSNAGDADLVIPAKKPAATGTAIEGTNRPQTLPLDSRITSKAVSPRERQVIAVGFQKPVIARAKTPAPAKNWAGNTKSTDLAQHR